MFGISAILGAVTRFSVSVLNLWLFFLTGGDRRPVFHDLAAFPAVKEIDNHFSEVRDEVQALLAQRAKMPAYHEVDPAQADISAKDGPGGPQWKVFMLYAMGEKPAQNRAACPRTCAVLDRVPNLFQAFFSILEAGKNVPAHEGPYLGYLRYHLGLIVPRERPPRIRIKDQFYTWQEGKSVMFDDSWNHQVVNSCPGDRVVLIVDVLRPLPLLSRLANHFVAMGLIRVTYGRGVLKNLH